VGENIDPTWIAFRGEPPFDQRLVDVGLGRVARHYAQLVDYPLETRSAVRDGAGLAVIGDAEPRCRWPHFAADSQLAVASAYAPTGWHRVVAGGSPDLAALRLARRIASDPDDVIRALSAPLAMSVLDLRSASLTVINDSLGAGRVFELSGPRLTVWSNRPGALHLFAGSRPTADPHGWRLIAAAGWLLGQASPIAGVRRLPPGAVVSVARGRAVEVRETDAVAELVAPDATAGDLVSAAARDIAEQAAQAARLWPGAADVDLSGGRDSRVVAAATIAAGVEARYLTSDATPGEAEVARALVAAAPQRLNHRVRKRTPGSASPKTPLLERAGNLHLLHDGVRHPQKLRGKMTLPRPRPGRARFSGHGGEIAHGFFYRSPREIRRLRGRRKRLPARVMRYFEKGHRAALPESYEAADEVVESTLDAGRRHGLRGPELLDWFYLVDRFAHRSGMATDSERVALFATPAVIAASFSLRPRERVEARLHDELIARLVPQWRGRPYFKAPRARVPRIRRERLWEAEGDAAAVEEILAAGGSWTELYSREHAVAAWRQVRAGGGSGKWESLFEGIVYRATFDQHLDALGRAAEAAELR
jgi:hypothetical protein